MCLCQPSAAWVQHCLYLLSNAYTSRIHYRLRSKIEMRDIHLTWRLVSCPVFVCYSCVTIYGCTTLFVHAGSVICDTCPVCYVELILEGTLAAGELLVVLHYRTSTSMIERRAGGNMYHTYTPRIVNYCTNSCWIGAMCAVLSVVQLVLTTVLLLSVLYAVFCGTNCAVCWPVRKTITYAFD